MSSLSALDRQVLLPRSRPPPWVPRQPYSLAARVSGGPPARGHASARSVPLAGWVALGVFLLLLLPALGLATSSRDDPGLDDHPLRPADPTSLGATLRSFQERVREVVRKHRARLPPAEVDRAISKVLDTL